MTVVLSGYKIGPAIYTGTRTLVYRGVRSSDNQPVAIKFLANPYPTFSELLQFRNQYAIAKNLNLSGIIRPYSLESSGNTYALIMEDCGSVSLRDYTRDRRLAIVQVLEIAVQVAQILHELHQNRVIHKDIKPANILIHPKTQQVKLIDFSIASLLSKETQEIKNPNVLEGTLAYLAPEQTGRMNRGIDYRSDFYALGVTLFELLTGKLPFEPSDAMELVHCHIAKMPPALGNSEEMPSVVADIVMKLMAKNAEDRYQSALGLKYDLEICLNQFQETGKIETFEIGQRDLCDRFMIPEKLYGREAEVQILLDAFDRVASPKENRAATPPRTSGGLGGVEMMLVAGLSGIGKTAVVSEVYKPITRQNGYFIKGKFDQFNRNIPFSAFVQAFRDFMGQLLGESDTQLASWKAKILQALGENARVLIEVIPELERIIGQQPPVPELSGSAAQNRFNLLFQKFIKIFTTKYHPLVMFLDDLQWADLASLNLLKLLMSEANAGYLLLLGAYRDREVFPAHPLMLMLDEIQKSHSIINTITLGALSEATVNNLVADTLSCPPQLAKHLTQLVYQKTQGNPFFTAQFLKALYEDGWIEFEPNLGYWQCDLTSVRQLSLTDDVVEFMALQLQKLPVQTQEVLKLAACIGNSFDLNTLAIVSEKSQVDTATDLWKALQEGSIVPINDTYKFFQSNDSDEIDRCDEIVVAYKFLHDRVQQAAYSLIPEDRKQLKHWRIGHLLKQKLSQREQADRIFNIVNQLNLGRATISKLEQRQQLAQLNLQAGQKAKLSAAYQAAQNYCEIGIEILPTEAWQSDYVSIYGLYREGSEAAYLCGNFERAEALYAIALAQAQTPVDKAVIYRVQMTQYQLQGRNAEAIEIQRQSLQLLDWIVPNNQESIQTSLDAQIAIVTRFLEYQTIESILELSTMTDENIAEMLRILQILFYAAWLDGQPTLALLALAKMTTLSLEYGNSDMSPFGYVGYGLIANALLKNAAQAYQFGAMAVQLCQQFDNADVRGMTNFLFAADVHSWSSHLREADPYYDNAFKYGMDAGNWLTVSFMMMQSGSDRLTYGKNLNDLYAIVQIHVDFLGQIKSLENLDALIVGVRQPIRQLLGLTNTPFTFDDENFSESEYLQKYRNVAYHLAWFYSVKIRHAYLFDRKSEYAGLIPKLSIIEETIPSHAKLPSSVFYVALMLLSLFENASQKTEAKDYWQAFVILEEKLKHWGEYCPENILHKNLLLQAEKARIKGEISEAIDFYEQSIARSQAQDYGYEQALANELAAKFYLNWGKEKVAAAYMQEAYYCYAKWGAQAKTNDLEQRYPQLLQPILQQATKPLTVLESLASISSSTYSIHSSHSKSSSSTSLNNTLDFAALLKVSQSLSSTIQLDDLIQTLTQTMLENSGADKCALMLFQNQQWFVRAIADLQQTTLQTVPLEDNRALPVQLIYYVKNTLEPIALDNLKTDLPMAIDPYLEQYQPKSVLCLPIIDRGNLTGILYLENRYTRGVFTSDRLILLNFLASQAAIALENARLYRQVQQTLEELQQAQLQMVQSEKMSALGNLVAGVAHEINNPIGCIVGNVGAAQDYINDLLGVIDLYREKFPQPGADIEDELEAIDLDYVREDLLKLIRAMKDGGDRITSISKSLRTFSRADSDTKQKFNLHDGIDSTVLILRHRLKANHNRPAIEVVTDYGNIPEITCFPGQLNQVFMNILANGIDALDESNLGRSFAEIQANPNQITIQTRVENEGVKIAIADNGPGMPEELKTRIFDHLFTTKGVGKGTGLGLAIARQIIVEKHQGAIEVNSQLGTGTEFVLTLPIDDRK
ncbi:ATP-binding sensor histidine kinase [Microcoleus sp. CAWBG58]|uniref:trifunctional serine/threonine-protein kinase/ATP-binding protein/sensor histidine kinase n=1 Tax=Microcoleus sp. CAWBG58 TaxID=2841651 RepID=UPI0025D581F1|nr:ATP-binding sensor histidine kinase [Microcoleus sp. CAWBG58]